MDPTRILDRDKLYDQLWEVFARDLHPDDLYDEILPIITKFEKEHDGLRKKAIADGWALEAFHQEQRDNFKGDGQW